MAPAQAIRETEQPRIIHAPLSGMVVLCIDNEPAILEGMRIVLEGWGCIVITASGSETARTALRAANQTAGHAPSFVTPDLIIADYHLDDEDGLSVIGLLRRQWGADMKAVLLTADRSLQVRNLAAEASIHVMNKPLKPAALRSFMAQARSQAQP